ncbi:hypothetical protein E7T06_12545 [Deinococcus sp. Arct2-2]|uniref:hypothetical protein n=1 Tax=Deinococcus sp. Arct2-2 TaxID=2568653 RepID=UPI0010A2D18E|nr:hypothetical protein [Deinococcus sp. Arct2-2]THF69313.1 hypothetical protein E7T06_12545 [Deinococcus sp. Arct2-2]
MAGKAARPSAMLQRLASTPAPIERTEPEAPLPSAEAASEGVMTRLSVDLDDAQFEFLTIFAMRQKVSKVEVMRALMAELQADPTLAERVSKRLPTRRRK